MEREATLKALEDLRARFLEDVAQVKGIERFSEAELCTILFGRTSLKPTYRFWPFELWNENRELFKEFMKHMALFVLLIASLEFMHRISALMTLPPEHVHLLSNIHFFLNVFLLLIFAFSLTMRVILTEFRSTKR